MKLIHSDASETSLKFFTSLVFGVWFLMIAYDPLPALADFSAAALSFKGFPLRLLPGSLKPLLLSTSFLYAFKISLLVFLFCRLFAVFPKTTGLMSALLLTAHQGFVRGFGYINHAQLAILYCVYTIVLADIIAYFMAGKKEAYEKEGFNFNSVPIIMAMLIFCFTYSFIGVRRLIWGGMEVYLSDSIIKWILGNAHQWGSESTRLLAQLVLEQAWLKNLIRFGFPLVTLFETLAPLCLVSRRFRYCFIAVMLPFHIFSYLFMGLFFWQNMLLFVLFVDFSRWFQGDSPKYVTG